MQKLIFDNWSFVMNHNKNPLKNIPDTNTRHMIMQILAWMWCIVFSFYFSSMWIFGITTVLHILLLGAIAITVATFETAKRKPNFFAPPVLVSGVAKSVEDPSLGPCHVAFPRGFRQFPLQPFIFQQCLRAESPTRN